MDGLNRTAHLVMAPDLPESDPDHQPIKKVGISKTVRPAKDPGAGYRPLEKLQKEQSAEARAKGKKKWLRVRKHRPDSDLSELVAFDEPRPQTKEKRPRAGMMVAMVVIGVAFLAILDAALRRRVETLRPALPAIEEEVPEESDLAAAMDARLEAVREVAGDYFAAANLEAQLEFIREPSRVRPLMERLQADTSRTPLGAPLRVGVGEAYLMDDTKRDAKFFMTRAEMKDYSLRLIAFERIGEGPWKLDWESFVAYSPMSWEEFQRRRPVETVRFRVVAGAGDYYNYDFADAGEFASFKLSDSPETIVMHGYVPRESALDRQLQSLLGSHDLVYILLDLRFPEDAQSDNQVEIVDVVSPTWVLGLEKSSSAAYRMMLPP